MRSISRRTLLGGAGGAAAAALLGRAASANQDADGREPLHLKFAVKYGMVQTGKSMAENFALLREIGFDGVELDSPNGYDVEEVRQAVAATGLPVHGVVDSIHWNVRLSDPDPNVRLKATQGLETAIRDVNSYGGSSVLLVPGRVADPKNENQEQVWARSIEGIHHCLPVAAELGVHILIENVWNGFCYDHDGPDNQSADRLAAYLDAVNSPWVGSYFDLGNHRKYGKVEDWLRSLGRRVVKLDVKDWGRTSGFCKIGDGDVDWPEVRRALHEIGYTGWCTAEVGGGDADRLREIKRRMDEALRA